MSLSLPRLSAFLLAALVALPLAGVPATSRAESRAVNLDALGLTQAELRQIGANRTTALRTYYGLALSMSPDGTVTRAELETRRKVNVARTIGLKMGLYLGYDLDGDLALSKAEFSALSTSLSGTQLVSLLILRDTGDTNGDGVVDLREMQALAKGGTLGSVLSRYTARREALLMKMDVDGDGRVTLDEIDAVVTAATNRNRENGMGANPFGTPRVSEPPISKL